MRLDRPYLLLAIERRRCDHFAGNPALRERTKEGFVGCDHECTLYYKVLHVNRWGRRIRFRKILFLNRNQFSRAHARIAQRVKHGDSSTEQGAASAGGRSSGMAATASVERNHGFGISTIAMDTGDLFVLAQHEIATAAGIAHETVTAMPAPRPRAVRASTN